MPDQIVSFMGVPVNEMPRDQLEREFCKAHMKIIELQREIADRSIAHIHDLASTNRNEKLHNAWFMGWLRRQPPATSSSSSQGSTK